MTCFPGRFPESFDMWKHSANCKILCKCSSIIVFFGQHKLAQISALQHNRHKYHINFNQMFSGQPSCWWHRDPSSLHFETLQSPRISWARPKRDIHPAHSNPIGQNSATNCTSLQGKWRNEFLLDAQEEVKMDLLQWKVHWGRNVSCSSLSLWGTACVLHAVDSQKKHGHFHELYIINFRASLVAQWQRIHFAMQEMWVQSLGWEDPLEEEMTTNSSILAWEV